MVELKIASLELAIEIVKLKAQNKQFGVTDDVYAEATKVYRHLTCGAPFDEFQQGQGHGPQRVEAPGRGIVELEAAGGVESVEFKDHKSKTGTGVP